MENQNTSNEVQEVVVESQVEQVTESVNTEVASVQGQEPVVAEKVEQSPEENAKFKAYRQKFDAEKAEAIEQARLEAKNEFVKKQFGLESISEYEEAVEKQKLDKRAKELMNDGYAEEAAMTVAEAEAIKSKGEIERKQSQSEADEKAKIDADHKDFLSYYQSDTGKAYDGKALDPSIWAKVKEGTPLKYAYMEWQHEQFKLGTQTQQANQEHASQATGSIDSVDSNTMKPLTAEDVENMSPKQLSKRWAEVKKVMKMR